MRRGLVSVFSWGGHTKTGSQPRDVDSGLAASVVAGPLAGCIVRRQVGGGLRRWSAEWRWVASVLGCGAEEAALMMRGLARIRVGGLVDGGCWCR